MTAKREAIFAEIETRMRAIAGVGEVERMPSGDPTRWPAIGIEDGVQSADGNTEPGVNRYDLPVTISGFVEGGGGSTAHAAANELYRAVVAAMISDPPLGGLAEEVTEGDLRMQVAMLADRRRIGFELDFSITFVADKFNPAAG